jgi:hypothetical protein
MFYEVDGHCEPCPDMMTSDAGAVGIAECVPYNRYVCPHLCMDSARVNACVHAYDAVSWCIRTWKHACLL